MAAGDDDDMFGDFAFAPFQSNFESNSLPFADDEWGDFVKSPQQPSPADPLSFSGNHHSNISASSSSSWVKPSGALPLSLFGGADEEEEENSGVSGGFNGEQRSEIAGDLSSSSAVKDVSNSQNFSISDLYNQFAQIDREKKPCPSISGRVSSVENDASLSSNQEASKTRSAVSESKSMDLNYTVGIEGDSQPTKKSDNEEFDYKSHAADSNKNEDLFGSWSQQFSGLVSYPNTTNPKLQASSSDLAMKSQQQQFNGSDGHGDGQWEFGNEKEVSKRNTHLPGSPSDAARSQERIKESNGSMGFFGTSTESVDYFASPSVSSTPSKEPEFVSIWTGTATPNGLISNRKLNMEQINMKDTLSSGPDVESGEFDEDFGEFTAASFENKSESREAFIDDFFSPSEGAAPTQNDKIQVDFMAPEVSKRNVNSSGSIRELDNSPDVFGSTNGSIDFFATSTEPVDYFSTSNSISTTSKEVDSTGVQSGTLDGPTPNAIQSIEQNKTEVLWDHDPFVGRAESDEDFGDFTTAAETGPKPGELSTIDFNAFSNDAVQYMDGKIQVDLMGDEASERRANSFVGTSDTKKSSDVFEMSNGSADLFGTSSELVDYFASSSGFTNTSQEVDVIGIRKNIATFDAFTPDIIEHNSVNGTLNHSPDVEHLEFDDDFGEFTTASAETVPHASDESANNLFSLPEGIVSTSDGKLQESKLNNQRGAIPLSAFGSEEPENEETEIGGSSNVQDVFQYQSTSDQRNSGKPTTVVSINDLISSLYSQAEQTSAINTVEKPTGNESSLTISISTSSPVKDGKRVSDDGIWDSMDAWTRDDSKTSSYIVENTTHFNVSSKLNPNDILSFYYTLKEELCIVIKGHIENHRQAEGDTTHSGEDARAASLENEFQLACEELEQMKFQSEESNLNLSGGSSFNKIVEVLQEPQFQVLESEYQLSSKLMLVEKDPRSAMELLRHSKAMLKILTIGTLEERRAYISIWYEMISACAQELKYGASIWNQALKKRVQSHLLSEPQGRKYVLALGEIYRVVAVLGASAKLYKPWTFSGLSNLPSIFSLLEECHAVWSASGLEEALSNVSSSVDTTSPSKSIKHILSLDALSLQNYVFSEKESLCQLSVLAAGVVPGMKITMWGNIKCFVTLANMWTNMIRVDPPELPDINLTDAKN